ncbi:hypothetical protein [Fervidicoccus sp.]|uniref:hypothetical protein n=1 Tax=Fervidicoccus sp. TaxID=2060324 RepID=UPI003D0FF528
MEKKELLVAIALLSLIFLTATASIMHAEQTSSYVKFFVYGETGCPYCMHQISFFNTTFSQNYYFCDISSNTTTCLTNFANWIRFSGMPLSVPQTFVIYNNTNLLAIVIGDVENTTFWNLFLSSPPNQTGFPVYVATDTGEVLAGYVNANTQQQEYIIYRFILGQNVTFTTTSTLTNTTTAPANTTTSITNTTIPNSYQYSGNSFIATLVSLAASDAVNICIISVYSLLIVTIAVNKSRKRAAISGLGFALGIFTGYLALGLGLLKVISSLGTLPSTIARYILAFYGIILIIYSAYSYLTQERNCIICKENEGKNNKSFLNIKSWMNKSPALHYILGLILSISLIPCSAGPYIVFILLLSTVSGMLTKILYLLIYDIIFVAPLLILLEIIVLTLKKVNERKVAIVRELVFIIAGLLLIVLAIRPI